MSQGTPERSSPPSMSSAAALENYDPHGYYHTARTQMHGPPPSTARSFSPMEPEPATEDDHTNDYEEDDDMAYDTPFRPGSRDPSKSSSNSARRLSNNAPSEPPSESLFVPSTTYKKQSHAPKPYRIAKTSQQKAHTAERTFRDTPRVDSRLPRHPAQRAKVKEPIWTSTPIERTVGRNKRESRYAGGELEWHVNKYRPGIPHLAFLDSDRYEDLLPVDESRMAVDEPQSPAAESTSPVMGPPSPLIDNRTRAARVEPASLKKRGLKKGQEGKVIKRGYGVNDPENIEIINLKENTNMSFEEIAKYLNDKRLNEGMEPRLTTTSVNGRYNRTAPTIFASQGKKFVPLSERQRQRADAKKHGEPLEDDDGLPSNNPEWSPEHDSLLVDVVKEYEAEKWKIVMEKFNARTDYQATRAQLAKRYVLL